MNREQAIKYLRSSGFDDRQIMEIDEALKTRYTIYNMYFPGIPLSTFRSWDDASERIRFLANCAGYPIEDFIIKEESDETI